MVDPAELDELVEGLSNADVVWDGTNLGLAPTVTSPTGERLVRLGLAAGRHLVAAMSDPDRFVVAHVILTRGSGVAFGAYPEWNGLAVSLTADGGVDIDPAQRSVLARRWQRWFDTDPHPRQLPD